MPRAGSTPVPPEAMSIGEVANPPFAILPDPAKVFAHRAKRFETLAERGGELAPYLRFLSVVSAAQDRIVGLLAAPTLPPEAERDLSRQYGMPPLGRDRLGGDPIALATFDALLAELEGAELPAASRTAITVLRSSTPAARGTLLDDALAEEADPKLIAETVLAAAALQVHLTRQAALLDAESLKMIANGTCPACGGAPVASAVMGREGMVNTRFCTCSLCTTEWHVVRVNCLSCGNERGIVFNGIDGGDENVKAETCPKCKSYTKILYQNRDPALEPVADDVASLGLDVLLAKDGFSRFSLNPFLFGY